MDITDIKGKAFLQFPTNHVPAFILTLEPGLKIKNHDTAGCIRQGNRDTPRRGEQLIGCLLHDIYERSGLEDIRFSMQYPQDFGRERGATLCQKLWGAQPTTDPDHLHTVLGNFHP
ncbi:hypothetical protein GURASL_22810 [Geotalea uraniireducens]|uniref:Uncharacterized protein n=1 Tax=Geotalea uraniireducens TaxID=351604 RepID=A0ABN6VSL8_9BACT|nr:hypothetical protein GURASL_22810 [Geotalea uraniireducens]